ncbi:MAG: hypothetical protein AB1779_06210 [Candidatus Thermoplasmatota archaeon]
MRLRFYLILVSLLSFPYIPGEMEKKWQSDVIYEGEVIYDIAVGDAWNEKDGNEIVAVSSTGIVIILWYDHGWKSENIYDDGYGLLTIAIGDVDAEHKGNEILVGGWSKHLILLKYEEGWKSEKIWHDMDYINTIAIGEVDKKNNAKEILIGGGNRTVTIVKKVDENWIGEVIASFAFHIFGIAIGDINETMPGEEVFVAGASPYLLLLNYDRNWNIECIWESNESLNSFGIGDLDMDGKNELIVTDWDGKVIFVKNELNFWNVSVLDRVPTLGSYYKIAIGDVEEHIGNEVVICGWNNYITIFKLEKNSWEKEVIYEDEKELYGIGIFSSFIVVGGFSKKITIVQNSSYGDFELHALENEEIVKKGWNATFYLSLKQIGVFRESVSMKLNGLKSDCYYFLPDKAYLPAKFKLVVLTSSLEIGNYKIEVIAYSTSKEKKLELSLIVQEQNEKNFLLSISPNRQRIVAGYPAEFLVKTDGAKIEIFGLQKDVYNLTFFSSSIALLKVSTSVLFGKYEIILKGEIEGIVHITDAFLEVVGLENDFVFISSHRYITSVPNSSFEIEISFYPIGNFESEIFLNINKYEKIEIFGFEEKIIPPYKLKPLFSIAQNAMPGVYSFTIEAKANGIIKSSEILVHVLLDLPDYDIKIFPAFQYAMKNESIYYVAYFESKNNFKDEIKLDAPFNVKIIEGNYSKPAIINVSIGDLEEKRYSLKIKASADNRIKFFNLEFEVLNERKLFLNLVPYVRAVAGEETGIDIETDGSVSLSSYPRLNARIEKNKLFLSSDKEGNYTIIVHAKNELDEKVRYINVEILEPKALIRINRLIGKNGNIYIELSNDGIVNASIEFEVFVDGKIFKKERADIGSKEIIKKIFKYEKYGKHKVEVKIKEGEYIVKGENPYSRDIEFKHDYFLLIPVFLIIIALVYIYYRRK